MKVDRYNLKSSISKTYIYTFRKYPYHLKEAVVSLWKVMRANPKDGSLQVHWINNIESNVSREVDSTDELVSKLVICKVVL